MARAVPRALWSSSTFFEHSRPQRMRSGLVSQRLSWCPPLKRLLLFRDFGWARSGGD